MRGEPGPGGWSCDTPAATIDGNASQHALFADGREHALAFGAGRPAD